VAPEDLAAHDASPNTTAAALPEDALSALTACRFCDERRCIDRLMEVFAPHETPRQFERHGVRLLLCQKRVQLRKRLQMIAFTSQIRLQIAEKSAGSLNFLALLRWALVMIFLWFGGMKFTAYEAAGIAPFIEHSPIMSWLHALFGVQGASYVIGVIELSTAAALILGAFQPTFSALGAAMSAATYLITLTFFLSTSGVAEVTAGGFPAISAAPGQFLLKDVVLLAASLSLLFASVQGPWLNVQKS
jgi:reactive chlorine resistance protein C